MYDVVQHGNACRTERGGGEGRGGGGGGGVERGGEALLLKHFFFFLTSKIKFKKIPLVSPVITIYPQYISVKRKGLARKVYDH